MHELCNRWGNPFDNVERGFDSIFQNPIFAGADTPGRNLQLERGSKISGVLTNTATGLPLPWFLVPPMALSRLVLGVHYPTDVLTGVVVGTVVAESVGAISERTAKVDA